MKRLILSVMVLTAMLSFSGCSDSVEDLAQDRATQLTKCAAGEWDYDKCETENKLLKKRRVDLNISFTDLGKLVDAIRWPKEN